MKAIDHIKKHWKWYAIGYGAAGGLYVSWRLVKEVPDIFHRLLGWPYYLVSGK